MKAQKQSYREYSTTVSKASVIGVFTQVCDGTMKLLELLSSMSNAVKELQEAEMRVQSALVGMLQIHKWYVSLQRFTAGIS